MQSRSGIKPDFKGEHGVNISPGPAQSKEAAALGAGRGDIKAAWAPPVPYFSPSAAKDIKELLPMSPFPLGAAAQLSTHGWAQGCLLETGSVQHSALSQKAGSSLPPPVLPITGTWSACTDPNPCRCGAVKTGAAAVGEAMLLPALLFVPPN